MSTLLATRLKNKRLELGLSQKELALGICEQTQISRMEKGNYMPGADLLFSLSKKLGVNMNYFFDESPLDSFSKLPKFKELSKKFLANRDYSSLKYIYEAEKPTKHNLPLSDQIYLGWIESLVDFYCENEKELAIGKLEKIYVQIEDDLLDFLYVANTLLNFYFDKNMLMEFEEFYSVINTKMENINFQSIQQFDSYIKIKYNFCRYLWQSDRIEEAIDETLDAISEYHTVMSNDVLADLYCMLGNISEGFSNKEIVKQYFIYSQVLYKMSNYDKTAMLLEKYIQDNY